jgi:hypothetical protein
MSSNYEDWTDWAGDHPEQAEAELRQARKRAACPGHGHNKDLFHANPAVCPERLSCEHTEVSASGYCENCGGIVADWEPDDAQLLTQTGTKDVAA